MTEKEKYELTNGLISCRRVNISDTRTCINQVFVLAGAISAFLMPAFFSANISPCQKFCLSLALILLLGCIVLGVISLSIVLGQEFRALAVRQKAVENNDKSILEIIAKEGQENETTIHDLRSKILIGFLSVGFFLRCWQ